jgi:hypothetical protein
MKAYTDAKRQLEEETDNQGSIESARPQTSSYNVPLTRAAYEWDHALQIATDRIWGDNAPSLKTLLRK